MTLRYRALQRYSLARALLALTEFAYANPEPEFSFGPLDLTAAERNGLTLTGSDLSGPQAALAAVPGLIEVPA